MWQSIDFRDVILRFDRELTDCYDEWVARFQNDSDASGVLHVCIYAVIVKRLFFIDPVLKFRAGLLPL